MITQVDSTKLYYFGTSLTSSGHYFWQCESDYLDRTKVSFEHIPFDPEDLPKFKGMNTRSLGYTEFIQIPSYSIIAINGSCTDTRPGSKSVFFVNREITKNELLLILMKTPIAKDIMNKLPLFMSNMLHYVTIKER